ncbi:MAG: hypothetical protein QF774_17200, partial [Nitrospinota bacterium]|nr:hypothetical protein [Nitrospinota bacterium]
SIRAYVEATSEDPLIKRAPEPELAPAPTAVDGEPVAETASEDSGEADTPVAVAETSGEAGEAEAKTEEEKAGSEEA